ncbi:hypothetical protein JYU34_004451 [Plutella xylostella]|uniref:FLYWCH-type domain-containing protein n=1 Tax=Plutella xylostella TaxID=51655 RepID=A0ABQ7QY26_PLUXY|nr:hypothetical protein JYU34_004451 [Plutella xylostella]
MGLLYEAIFCESRFGRPVIQLGRFRFNRRSDSRGPRGAWVCGKKAITGCRATLITLENQIINGNAVVFGLSRYGRPVVTVGTHRFNQTYLSAHGRGKWNCVKVRLSGCKASLVTNHDQIISYNNCHNH